MWYKIEQNYFKAGAAQAAAAFSTKITALRGDVKGGGVSLRSSRLLTFRLQPVSPACGRQRTQPKEHSQLCVDYAPVLPPSCPLLRNIHHGQIQHFQQTVIRWKHRFCLGHFPKLPVKALNCVGRIDQAAHLLGIFEIGTQVGPILPPGRSDLRVFFVPAFGKVSRASGAAASSTAA